MANTGRYSYCPATRKIRGNHRTFTEWLAYKFRRREAPDMYMICDYYPAYYPTGYKK